MELGSPARLSTEAHELRTGAAALRALARDIAATLATAEPFDRDDVWQGGVAEAFRARHAARRAQVTDLWGGPLTELGRTATDWERRAGWLDVAATTCPI